MSPSFQYPISAWHFVRLLLKTKNTFYKKESNKFIKFFWAIIKYLFFSWCSRKHKYRNKLIILLRAVPWQLHVSQRAKYKSENLKGVWKITYLLSYSSILCRWFRGCLYWIKLVSLNSFELIVYEDIFWGSIFKRLKWK